MVRKEVCFQRPCHGGLGLPLLLSHKRALRLAFLGRIMARNPVWGMEVAFQGLRGDLLHCPVEVGCSPTGESAFLLECQVALIKSPGRQAERE